MGEAFTLRVPEDGRRRAIHLLPILHGELEFAQLLPAAFEQIAPSAIAVELPRSSERHYLAAVRRLPRISAIRQPGARADGAPSYLLVEPTDALTEAVRLGLHHRLPIAFVDLAVADYPEHDEPLPDPYAVLRLGHEPYARACMASAALQHASPADLRREAAMAARLDRLASAGPGAPILFVCGMAHAHRIADLLLSGAPLGEAEPLDRLPPQESALFNLHPDSCREVLSCPGYWGAAYERARAAALGAATPEEAASLEPPRVIDLFGLMSAQARGAEPRGLLAGSTGKATTGVPRPSEPPPVEPLPVDRQRLLLRLFEEAGDRYRRATGEELRPYHRRVFLRFLRNWALLRGRLQPSLYQLLCGARSAVDENFAYEVWRLSTEWPWQESEAELPTERLTLEELGRDARALRFRPKVVTRRLRALGRRVKLGGPDEWLQGFADAHDGHCSYPPEDLALESFSDRIKRRAKGMLSEENKRIERFGTSMLDGIEMRETLRNWHREKALYVAELRRGLGEVGSVVVLFDEDREKYGWEITWMGEHAGEGDMALFSTHPLSQIVGPGICRAEYGGFLLSYPPGRMADIWSDEAFGAAQSRGERLLLAGVDYCEERVIAYVAKRPPRPEVKAWAARVGKKISYLPIGQFSPETLKRLRVFHVLFGKERREVAADYIW